MMNLFYLFQSLINIRIVICILKCMYALDALIYFGVFEIWT